MKKSKIPAILIWVLYGLTAGCCLFLTTMTISSGLGYSAETGLLAGAIVLIVTGFLVYGIGRVKKAHAGRETDNRSGMLFVIIESLLVVTLLVGMVLFRAMRHCDVLPWNVTGDPVFALAQVASGAEIPYIAHRGLEVYTYLLRGCILFLGNKELAAVTLQLILVVTAALSLYCGIRKSAGVPAALVFMVFFGFAPYMMLETCRISPFLLVLTVYGLALGCISSIPEKMGEDRVSAIFHYIVTGLLIGFCCYLDMAGITLLIFLTANICFDKVDIYDPEDSRNEILVFAGCIAASVVGYLGSHYIRSLGGGTVAESVNDQLSLYLPEKFSLPVTIDTGMVLWDVPILALLMAVGIFSFWISHRIRTKSVWLFAAALLMVMQCFHMNETESFNAYALLYLFCVVMAGISVEDLLTADKREIVSETGEPDLPDIVSGEKESPSEEISEDRDELVQVQFIENPLPLPKKREHKVLDYDYEVADDDDFDI